MKEILETIRRYVWWTLSLSALFSFIVFSFQNPQSLPIKFLAWESPALPLPYFVFVAFAVGVFFAGFVGLFEKFKVNSRLRKLRRMNELLEREVDALRNQPLFDEPPTPASSAPPTGESPPQF